MAKKVFGDLAKLTGFAAQFPTQRPTEPAEATPAEPVKTRLHAVAPVPAPVPAEPMVKQTFELREAQRDQLERLAREAKMPTRAFILAALRAKGLDVLESDLLDGRKRRRG